ncbi:MAG: chromophore lyase CpcT/CpeT [Kaiparowitsia implicata GSE-PSE-MK54-09C]|nr:chromophore lyase CpcT/CpeT [Kaiparowitsia implicata GSE-PSE-MK54-09C]
MTPPPLMTVAQWLAGEFDNKPQAMEQPAWFVHLRLWHRPLPMRLEGNLAIFAEQANALYPDNAYRQRVLMLREGEALGDTAQDERGDRPLHVQYFAFHQPERFKGAGANPQQLQSVVPGDLERLPGCVLHLTPEGNTWAAKPVPGSRCCFQYAGETRQVEIGFDVGIDHFKSYDKGVDPQTGQGLRGALMGAYEFTKCCDFSSELPV